jgi:hypothetical protein
MRNLAAGFTNFPNRSSDILRLLCVTVIEETDAVSIRDSTTQDGSESIRNHGRCTGGGAAAMSI